MERAVLPPPEERFSTKREMAAARCHSSRTTENHRRWLVTMDAETLFHFLRGTLPLESINKQQKQQETKANEDTTP